MHGQYSEMWTWTPQPSKLIFRIRVCILNWRIWQLVNNLSPVPCILSYKISLQLICSLFVFKLRTQCHSLSDKTGCQQYDFRSLTDSHHKVLHRSTLAPPSNMLQSPHHNFHEKVSVRATLLRIVSLITLGAGLF